jgi:hypothetical protein
MGGAQAGIQASPSLPLSQETRKVWAVVWPGCAESSMDGRVSGWVGPVARGMRSRDSAAGCTRKTACGGGRRSAIVRL